MRSPEGEASRASARYFSMIWRALPRTAGPLPPLLWFREVPPARPLPRPCDRFALGPCLIRCEFKLIPSFEILFSLPFEVTDNCSSSRAPILDDWFGGFAFSSQSLFAQHKFAMIDCSTNCSPRHAFKSSSSAFAFLRLAASNSQIL